MTKWWDDIVLPIRDKLVAIIAAQATTNEVTVGEPNKAIAGLHGDRDRYPDSGFYVLPPSTPDPNLFATVRASATLKFQVVCNVRRWTEAQHLDQLGKMVGAVFDALAAKATLDGLAGVSEAGVSTVHDPHVGFGQGDNPNVVTQTIVVSIKVQWTVT